MEKLNTVERQYRQSAKANAGHDFINLLPKPRTGLQSANLGFSCVTQKLDQALVAMVASLVEFMGSLLSMGSHCLLLRAQ